MPTEIAIPQEARDTSDSTMQMVERVLHYSVTNDHEYGLSGGLLVNVKERAKELDSIEKSITRPLALRLKRIRAFFHTPKQRLIEAEKHLEHIRTAYRDRWWEEATKLEQVETDRNRIPRTASTDTLG